MISFVIPVYNPEPEILKKCIKSLKDQSYKDWEAIAVMDGPNLGAEAIINSFGDKRIRVINKAHGGASAARNEGFKHTKADIVCFWDCDCVIEPDTCKTWMDTFKDEPGVDFVYSGYKFMGENGGIASEPFDPWLLECGNYISTNFPMRRKVFPGFDETLKSLQDWEMWLTVVENGGNGLFIPGFAFSTPVPTATSISGQGCTDEVWLSRVNAVKVKHNLPDRKVCVSSASYKQEGIRLAKLIDADYKDVPNFKPNHYDTVIQLGFSLNPSQVKFHSGIFSQPLKKKIIFWTVDNIAEINNALSHRALKEYSKILNNTTIQFVEDLQAKKTMESAGFKVEIMPMPMVNTDKIESLPETPRVLVDITEDYRQIFTCLSCSLPDIQFDFMTTNKPIKEYSTLLSLNSEKTMSFNVKRMLLTGRNIISNIHSPFCGYVEDDKEVGLYINELVDTIRKQANKPAKESVKYYKAQLTPDKLLEAINK